MLYAKTIWASSGLRDANWILWMDWVRRDSFGLLVGLVRQLEEACLPLHRTTDTLTHRRCGELDREAGSSRGEWSSGWSWELHQRCKLKMKEILFASYEQVRSGWAVNWGNEKVKKGQIWKWKLSLCSIWWVEQSFGIKRTNFKCQVNVTFLCAKLNLSSTIWGSCTFAQYWYWYQGVGFPGTLSIQYILHFFWSDILYHWSAVVVFLDDVLVDIFCQVLTACFLLNNFIIILQYFFHYYEFYLNQKRFGNMTAETVNIFSPLIKIWEMVCKVSSGIVALCFLKSGIMILVCWW